ncbi:MAG: ferredoxin, partial [Gammaproteobacteria bacterium]|nr:ferredoxin [Gammaproteobacteria bacterium]
IENRIRQEVVTKIAKGLAQFATNGGAGAPSMGEVLTTAALPAAAPAAEPAAQAKPAAEGDYMAPWIDTDECTACDECIKINSAMFEYNESKKAIITNPDAGPYSDLVKAAEKCTAQVIHPGLPRDRSASGIDKWMARGGKFN